MKRYQILRGINNVSKLFSLIHYRCSIRKLITGAVNRVYLRILERLQHMLCVSFSGMYEVTERSRVFNLPFYCTECRVDAFIFLNSSFPLPYWAVFVIFLFLWHYLSSQSCFLPFYLS